MPTFRTLVIKLMMILLVGALMGSDVECDVDDDKIEVDFDRVIDPDDVSPVSFDPF